MFFAVLRSLRAQHWKRCPAYRPLKLYTMIFQWLRLKITWSLLALSCRCTVITTSILRRVCTVLVFLLCSFCRPRRWRSSLKRGKRKYGKRFRRATHEVGEFSSESDRPQAWFAHYDMFPESYNAGTLGCFRSAFALLSLCFRFAFALLSLCFRSVVALLSLCFRFVFALFSLCFCFAFALLSPCILYPGDSNRSINNSSSQKSLYYISKKPTNKKNKEPKTKNKKKERSS